MKRSSTAAAVVLIAAVALLPRLAALPAAGEDRLTPDGARFLNLARSLERGLGYVTPEAWPAWLEPESLPVPESFKEPGYPFAIAATAPLAGDPFRAARAISLVTGLLTPLATALLALALGFPARVVLLGALLAAGSPVLIRQSVYVMAESPFALLTTLAFALAALRPRGGRGAWAASAGAGAALGLAYLVRAQGLIAVPAVAGLLFGRRPARESARHALAAFAAAALVALPWWLRNMRVFGDPFHSDVAPFALWPYVDTYAFSHGLERPGSVAAFVLGHPAEILARALGALRHFAWHTLPHDLLASRIWLVPFGIGLIVAVFRRRETWPLLVFALLSTAFLLPLHWVARYFAAVAPIACVLAAIGLESLVRDPDDRPIAGRLRTVHAVAAGVAVLLALGCVDAVRSTGDTFHPELAEARAAGPLLREALAPDEAVMAELTSYWAWHSDRPAVYPVVADDSTLRSIARRLRVRRAAFTAESESLYAGRLAGGRLPAWFVPDTGAAVPGARLYDVRPDPSP